MALQYWVMVTWVLTWRFFSPKPRLPINGHLQISHVLQATQVTVTQCCIQGPIEIACSSFLIAFNSKWTKKFHFNSSWASHSTLLIRFKSHKLWVRWSLILQIHYKTFLFSMAHVYSYVYILIAHTYFIYIHMKCD